MPRGIYERVPGRFKPNWTPEARAKQSVIMAEKSRGNQNAWKTGRTKSGNGYVFIVVGRAHPMADKVGRALEHRIVMAAAIGRVLGPKETVHHINGRPDDNRIENLILFANQRAHMAHHAKERRAA